MSEISEITATQPQMISTSTYQDMGIVVHDSSSVQIAIVKLDGTNYLAWSQSAKWSITGRGKWGYISGESNAPNPADLAYQKWKVEDVVIVSWLLHSLQPDISNTYFFLQSSKEIWDALEKTYSEVGHLARVYELRQKVWQQRQGE